MFFPIFYSFKNFFCVFWGGFVFFFFILQLHVLTTKLSVAPETVIHALHKLSSTSLVTLISAPKDTHDRLQDEGGSD